LYPATETMEGYGNYPFMAVRKLNMSVSIPSYRHHKHSGQAVVTLNGLDFYLGTWQSTESRQEFDRHITE